MNTGQVVDHSARLPSDVLRLAERLGATPDSSGRLVRLTQAGSMRDDPERRFMSFTAKQTIATDRTEFAWRARTGPLGFITVVDAFENDAPRLDVRVLGWLRLASVRGEAAAAKGEIMRYLAELPWAPDAILANRHLVWRVVDGQTLRVSCRSGSVRGEVELKLNGQGCVGEVCSLRIGRAKKGRSSSSGRGAGGSSIIASTLAAGCRFAARSAGTWTGRHSSRGVESS